MRAHMTNARRFASVSLVAIARYRLNAAWLMAGAAAAAWIAGP